MPEFGDKTKTYVRLLRRFYSSRTGFHQTGDSTLNRMSCVLRISAVDIETRVQGLTFGPYRLEQGTAYFLVSDSSFDDLPGQVEDAIEFLRKHANEISPVATAVGAEATLDFAVEYWEPGFFTRSFPAQLVAASAGVGLALALSAYPSGGGDAV